MSRQLDKKTDKALNAVLDQHLDTGMDNFMEMRRAFFRPAGPNEPDAMHQEKSDAQWVKEDHTAMANLSNHGYQVEFNPNGYMQRIGTDRGIPYPANTARKLYAKHD